VLDHRSLACGLVPNSQKKRIITIWDILITLISFFCSIAGVISENLEKTEKKEGLSMLKKGHTLNI
jgi:hypothetical protein